MCRVKLNRKPLVGTFMNMLFVCFSWVIRRKGPKKNCWLDGRENNSCVCAWAPVGLVCIGSGGSEKMRPVVSLLRKCKT